jgi:2,4-dienoyl-CoA reductase-like NADH-dependent reductase (Old Yellow Enzyme family)
MSNLFETVQLGSLVLANRIFMAPLTRNRADADGVPGELAATYYSQRASAGLIVTEATQISPMGKGYLHVVETAQNSKGSSAEDLAMSAHLRTLWKGLYVVNGGYDRVRGEEALRTGHADAVAYGRAFLANPDLPLRLQIGAALNEPDPKTFYGGGAAGYINYPALS